jgi:hypothetical protein
MRACRTNGMDGALRARAAAAKKKKWGGNKLGPGGGQGVVYRRCQSGLNWQIWREARVVTVFSPAILG